jgi:glycosyltransferase involved in cell wall biosynthesis
MSSRPRFLLTLLAWAGGISGGDRHLLEVAARWRSEVDVAVLAPPQATETISSFLGDVPVHELGWASRRQAALGPTLALEYVRRAIVATLHRLPTADVVAAASHFTPDSAAIRATTKRGALGVSYVYHLIAGRTGFAPRTLWSKADERVGLALLRRSAGVVFVSNEETASVVTRRGFDPVRTAVGIDVLSFEQSSLAGVPPRGIFLARMTRTKGVEDALRTWALVRRSVPDAKLAMVGTGSEQQRGRTLAAELGIADAVEWHGFVSEDEKRRILADSRLLLAPSREEGWGISVCEALASGVPVVAYRLPTLDELFGSSYSAVPIGETAALAASATHILTDQTHAAELAKRGRETASRYDVGRVAAQELDVILTRLASMRRRAR